MWCETNAPSCVIFSSPAINHSLGVRIWGEWKEQLNHRQRWADKITVFFHCETAALSCRSTSGWWLLEQKMIQTLVCETWNPGSRVTVSITLLLFTMPHAAAPAGEWFSTPLCWRLVFILTPLLPLPPHQLCCQGRIWAPNVLIIEWARKGQEGMRSVCNINRGLC